MTTSKMTHKLNHASYRVIEEFSDMLCEGTDITLKELSDRIAKEEKVDTNQLWELVADADDLNLYT